MPNETDTPPSTDAVQAEPSRAEKLRTMIDDKLKTGKPFAGNIYGWLQSGRMHMDSARVALNTATVYEKMGDTETLSSLAAPLRQKATDDVTFARAYRRVAFAKYHNLIP